MKRFAAMVGIGLLLLVGCGKETSTPGADQPPVSSGNYFYDLSDPQAGCTTGKHVYSSLKDLCRGLQDDGANHSCALQARKDKFAAANCTGRFNG